MYTDLKKCFFDLSTIKKYVDGKCISAYQCKSVANLCVLGRVLKTHKKISVDSVVKYTNYG